MPELRKVLIISPNFPPVNAPDMQRVRMSLPYFRQSGWEPTVICVEEKYVEGFRDPLLLETIPDWVNIHRVKAFPTKITRKFGLGSLSLRSFFQFKKKGNELLSKEKFDLVYFSTTMFHVLALGRYWKSKFGVPFVVDMQDPWRNDFYLERPKEVRPPKYQFAYQIHKRMEAWTMPHTDGIISVSQGYIDVLRNRYPVLSDIPAVVIPFGTSVKDFEKVRSSNLKPMVIDRDHGKINVVYIGALLSQSFMPLLNAFFKAFKKSVPASEPYHFYFIGTNYSPHTQVKAIHKLAEELDLSERVTEYPDRIPYFSALATLMKSDIIFIPGSIDIDYNASKVYNNILTGRPIFSIFNQKSHVLKIIEDCNAGLVVGLEGNETEDILVEKICARMDEFRVLHLRKDNTAIHLPEDFFAGHLTRLQTDLFLEVKHRQENSGMRKMNVREAAGTP